MSFPAPSVAILLFARSAAQEATHKPLVGYGRASQRAWQALENLTWAKIKATNVPAFRSYELIQPVASESFGQQLQRATEAVFRQGFDTVICVGNDCPSLRVTDLRQAVRQVRSGTLPVGVDARGGTYLLSLNRALCTVNEQFAKLPWQTNQLASAFARWSAKQGQPLTYLTATRRDWNYRADIQLNEAVGERTYVYALAEVLGMFRSSFFSPVFLRPQWQRTSGTLRGPPVRVHC